MTEHTLKFFHMVPYRNVLVKNLSGGNRRKLNVAVTCFGSSTNVLMDEPTSDLVSYWSHCDIENIMDYRSLINNADKFHF